MSEIPNQLRYVHLTPEQYEQIKSEGKINENYLYFVDNQVQDNNNKEDNKNNE
jgi:hypothetical protein